ncbi:hypothetical protein PY650_18400 [Rhizobium calliandrae]|uniref:Uncharacterized protein n=1 Tax=Rhizobium calliandrae TaxID=1312182 RepID=A0ABT7KK51_9HYPH|nr:hypothetical protein [Rhizobium calliandrae]MDL2407599.1 hypothetical protein [Rhizobium calliandrae]
MQTLSFCETAALWGSTDPKGIPGTVFSFADVTPISAEITGSAKKTASVHVSSPAIFKLRIELRNDPELIASRFSRDTIQLRKILKANGYERIAITGPLACGMFVKRKRVIVRNNILFAMVIPVAFLLACFLILIPSVIWSIFGKLSNTIDALKFLLSMPLRAICGFGKHYIIDFDTKLGSAEPSSIVET